MKIPSSASAQVLVKKEKWVAVLLSAVIIVATGGAVGAGSATADIAFPRRETNFRYPWYVVNATAKTVSWGQVCKTEVGHLSPLSHSTLEFGGHTPWAPLKPGDRTADAFLTSIVTAVNFTSGIFLIDGRWWAPAVGYRTRFHRTSGEPWEHVWIFWDVRTDTPFLTQEGGGDNIILESVDGPYGNFNACTLLGR